MIVIARRYGQLGNRLFLYAHLIAAARHYGVQLANPAFAEYANLFPATATDLWCRYPVVSEPVVSEPAALPPPLWRRQALAQAVEQATVWLHRFGLTRYPYNVVRLRGDETCDLAGDGFGELVQQERSLLAHGWLFRSEGLLQHHGAAIRDHFRIGQQPREKVDRLIQSIRRESECVVGVHIRRGDYATFMNGRYFFRIADYAAVMRRIREQSSGCRVSFLVCSDGPLAREDFGDLPVVFGSGKMLEDLYSLAEADLLVGPPSTFTGWASFYGKVPLIVLEDPQQSIDVAAELGNSVAA